MAKAASWIDTDTEVRKRGEQTGLDTLDGDPHKRWSMWFNSMQREKPYLLLTYLEALVMRVCLLEPRYRCCMAVVSSCREMFR